ncbi:MAG TPA: methyl-accepting chemotaxis protein [Bacteroidales bacterium]|nr:methyl-accepting chemotaxis protein [Bacteroidales bacterium]
MNFFVSNLISILAAGIAAVLLLNRFFKNSIFIRVGIIWLINLLFIMLTVGIKYKYYDGHTGINILIALINIGVSVVCFYYGSISVVRPLTKAIDKLDEIANGNLDTKIEKLEVDEQNDLGKLILASEKIKQNLTRVVTDINDNVVNLSDTSQQLSDVSQRLSMGATSQASSVEEVSSSMEEMVANIQQNTDNAQQTEKISEKISDGVQKVGESSKESLNSIRVIASKISIINDIAFQTNILALNAAVEAARAGEHGRGFAVVAAEVRKLAERSKLAADEIVTLATQSVNITENSSQLLETLIGEIVKSAKLVQEITAASIEQSSGAVQINNAIQELNTVTQQNVVVSEKMSTGSEKLNQLAAQLQESIGYFKVDKGRKK